MNAKINAKFNNRYHVELIDSVSGELKQSGDFHNIAVVNINTCILGTSGPSSTEYSSNWYYRNMGSKLSVGNGTVEPAYANTTLSSLLWTISASSKKFEWVDEYTGRGTYVFNIPASSSYVGTITEVGLRVGDASKDSNIGPMVTRALLTDSEGNIISFEKTDLDILSITVVVEVSINSLTNDFTIFRYPKLIYIMLADAFGTTNSYHYILGVMNLCRYHFDLYGSYSYERFIDTAITPSDIYRLHNTSEAYVRFPVTRLGTDTITSERYFKGIAMPGIGYWKLPNENIFPAYTISGINIETGDGVTTQFENPLCYFKADTDKVYKNGVLLTRDVDYTLNNIGNKDCLPEVAEFKAPISVKSAAAHNTSFNFRPMFLPSVSAYADGINYAKFFSNTNPLYIEYDEAITANCLKCTGGFRALQGTNGYTNVPAGTYFYLDASTDGITYNEVGSATITSSSDVYKSGTAFTIDFEDTTAKYWRLRTSYSSYPIGMYYDSDYQCYIMLNRKDQYIKFTTAPAVGDVLTMDVDMDVIMKNSNFVVDIGCRIDFSIGG